MPTTATVTGLTAAASEDLAQAAYDGLSSAASLLQSTQVTLAGTTPVVLDMMLADADSVRHVAARMGSGVTEKRLGWFTLVETLGDLDGIRVLARAHTQIQLRRDPAVTAELAERDA